MNTALFLSLFTLFGNPLGPTTTVRQAAIAPALQVRATTSPTVRVQPSASPTQVTPIRRPRTRVPVRNPRLEREPQEPQEPQGTGAYTCTVLENGAAGAASYRVVKGSQTVATGRCGSPASIAAGDYRIIVTLDGMADGANRNMPLTIRNGRTSSVRAVFETSRLTVTTMHDGRRIPGRAVLKKNGRVVASLGSGVYSKVSSGTYQVEVTVNYGSVRGSRTIDLELSPGQVRALNVPF